ncbi:beta-1,3-galactosyltransferase 2-like [Engystomops pustulosus]|uniref:beta-1,3-galactosyltransferase 2-like n=1 Tax=Engystomops pustulosus TaxID=76066 RepID=UPI003AFB05C8
MAGRSCLRKFFVLPLLLLIFLSFYLLYYERSSQALINEWIQDYVKLHHREKPAHMLTYPAFKHPLAPPYPYPYKFLINQPDKCKNRKPFLVLMVLVESHDLESRQTIRETWGNDSLYDVDVVTVFLVGLPQFAPVLIQVLLEEESLVYGDIIQQDFMDTYYNLTLKTLMGIEWVTKFCSNTSYIMKIDNDMFLNVDYVVHKILDPEVPLRENFFTGDIRFNTPPFRDRTVKWYVPKEIYPNDTYPPYCTGPGYVFSIDVAKKIYDVAQTIRVIPMEDVFMGICLYELHIKITIPEPWTFNTNKFFYDACGFRLFATVHHFSNYELRSIWKDFVAKKSQC